MGARGIVLSAGERESAGKMRAGLVCVAVATVVGLGGLGCARSGPGTARSSDELLTQLQQDRTQIDQTSDTMMKRIDMFNSSRKPGERTLQFSEIFTQDLNPEQRDVLDTLVQQEKDISYKALLGKIISDRNTIRELQDKVMHLEQSLPDKFVVAKRGDRHQDLAIAYLTGDAGLDQAKTKELLKQIDLTDELLPGNQVWFFYDPQKDTFRTYVTAGDAGQTPVAMRRARTRQLVKERDAYKQERDTAQEHVASLEQDKSQLEDELVTRQNSLYYHAESDQSLKEQGVLSPVLKRVRDVKGVSYDQALDLRAGTSITLDPRAYGLDRIRSVRLLPSIYQEGRDFSVEIEEDHSSARLLILDPDVFKGKEVLLALHG
jgi:hypothetical protein